MGTWVACFLSFCFALSTYFLTRRRRKLPPGPPALYILVHLLWFSNTLAGFHAFMGSIWSKYGPLVCMKLGSFSAIMVADRNLAHKMLIDHGAAFADRPPLPFALHFISSNNCSVGSAHYGHMWRIIRRNLVEEMLHVSRIPKFVEARQWSLQIFLDKLKKAAGPTGDNIISFREMFHHIMFCQVFFLCFGEKLNDENLLRIKDSQTELLQFVGQLNLFTSTHKLFTYLFGKTYRNLIRMRNQQNEIFLPLIISRRQKENSGQFCYLDSLLNLEIPQENGRKLTDDEVISLCSEILNAAPDSISSAMEWIMANIVKYPSVQEKLAVELANKTVEEDLECCSYLRAVIVEGLRRHPPAHMLLPREVKQEICLDGFTIPKGATLNFGVKSLNLDGEVWPDPLEFRPERFLPGGGGRTRRHRL